MAQSELVSSFKSSIGAGLQAGYSEVHVLLITWAENDLDGVEDEVEELRAVFEKQYNYTVSRFLIPSDGFQLLRLNMQVCSFMQQQSQRPDSLFVVYYAGHCDASNQGQAEWAAFEKGGPTLQWHITQQLLFSAGGDVLLILDCCRASLITRGVKSQGGRLELIAASAIGAKTPIPGRTSFTRGLVRILKEHAEDGISSESLASRLREDSKITVFHDFVRQSATKILLRRLDPHAPTGVFIRKPTSYLLFRASLSDDVTGTQIANWLKTAPPRHVTAVSIEAIVTRARCLQEAMGEGPFPDGSFFTKLSKPVRDEITRCMRNLDTVMASTENYIHDATADDHGQVGDVVSNTLEGIQNAVSTMCAAVETPLLLKDGTSSTSLPEIDGADDRRFLSLAAAADVDAALGLHNAVISADACDFTLEIETDTIIFDSNSQQRGSRGGAPRRRFRFGQVDSKPVLMETYKYVPVPHTYGIPHEQTIQQLKKITGMLRHPKRDGFRILPCLGFYCDRNRSEMGLIFRQPDISPAKAHGAPTTLLQLYKQAPLVPLGHRIHLAWALATTIENFHRVGWVHKGFRSDNIAFTTMPATPVTGQSDSADSQAHGQDAYSPPLPMVGDFDISKPLLFGFEYSRAGDDKTNLDEDFLQEKNLYRIPQRWGRPEARFEKSHDVYSLGVVLLEVAMWKDVGSILKIRQWEHVVAKEVAKGLMEKCNNMLKHQVGQVLTQCILTCLDFKSITEGHTEYQAHVYFQQNVVKRLHDAVGRI